jgi:diguanylate cyclase (GGDEF)-like protein/PAS domain S-box-containing protein
MSDAAVERLREESERDPQAEIVRLNKIVTVLMDRAERSTNSQGSDFCQFQTTVMLEEQVRRRTEELEKAMREIERIDRALRESEAKFRSLVGQTLVGVSIVQDGRFTYVNPRLAEMLGYSMEEMLGVQRLDITLESDRPLVAEQMRRRLSGEADHVTYAFRGVRKDGAVIDMECYGSAMDISGKPALINVTLDISERTRVEREVQALQQQLREQAIHDPLTRLYNRLPLNEFFERELYISERYRRSLSVVLADIDHFKAVNDTYGHAAGDQVLRVFADLLKGSYRASDIVCRYGGEEFLILLPDMTSEGACARTEQLRAALARESIVFEDATIRVTASFGVATFPDHRLTRDVLIAAADHALYEAKERGRNRVEVYSQAAVD